jgi:protease secretion system outer membrane protein
MPKAKLPMESLVKCVSATVKLFLTVLCLNSNAAVIDEAIQSAIRNDPTLRSSKLNQLAANEGVSLARSRLLPQINLQGTTSQLSQTTVQELSGGGTTSRTFSGPSINHQLVIRQTLLRTKDLSSVEIANLQSEYAALKYQYDAEDLKSRVIYALIDLLAAKQIAAAWEASIELTETAVKQEKAKYFKGESTKDALAEINGQYQNINGSYLQALENLNSKKMIFENLTKVSAILVNDAKIPLETHEMFLEKDKDLFLNKINQESLELKMSRLQVAIQLEKVKMTSADHHPTLDILAAINIARNDATSTQGYQYKNKQIGIQYSVPISAGGGLISADKQAQNLYEASLLDSEAVFNRVTNEFENNWSLLIGNNYKNKGLKELLKAADEQLWATKRSYQLGVKPIADVANIQQLQSRRLVDYLINLQEFYKLIYKTKKEIKLLF